MRLLVTGSRTWKDRRTLGWALDVALALSIGRGEELTVVHGAAREGADALTHEWVQHRKAAGAPVQDEPHPATWRRPDGAKDKGAGFARNAIMVSLGADYCLAFVERCTCPDTRRNRKTGTHGTHGSVDCLTRAADAGIPTRTFQPRRNA